MWLCWKWLWFLGKSKHVSSRCMKVGWTVSFSVTAVKSKPYSHLQFSKVYFSIIILSAFRYSIRSLICRCAFYLLALTITAQIIMLFLIAQFSPESFMWIEHKGHWTWDCPLLAAKITEYGLLPPSNLTLYLLTYQGGWNVSLSVNPVLIAKVYRLQVWQEHHNTVCKKRVCLWQLNVTTAGIYSF
jgi:hypothetical protein